MGLGLQSLLHVAGPANFEVLVRDWALFLLGRGWVDARVAGLSAAWRFDWLCCAVDFSLNVALIR